MSRFKVKDNNDQWVDISANGVGVPSGGNQGQILAKRSGTNYDAGWVNPSGGVHVGPTAPTDAFTTIWLDTDEQGASIVNSVNSKNGTVVLDADDVGAVSQYELLWTNASPNSMFNAQTISLDLSGYDFVMIQFYDFNNQDSDRGRRNFVIENNSTAPLLFGWPANRVGYRKATVSSTGVQFGGCTYNNATANDTAVPFKIYGIRGMVAS